MKWVSVKDELPKHIVLVSVDMQNGSYAVYRACYFAQFQEQTDDEDNFEYCDTDDEYYIPAGWYECISNWEEYSSVKINDGVVTHWMNLPEPSKKEW
jgi:hypothetical protein